jgi:hypothetical protein
MMTSLLALNALNFFMADVRDGLGPFLGVFLQGRGWPPAEIGLVMTIGGYAGMIATTPLGAFVDATKAKRGLMITSRSPSSRLRRSFSLCRHFRRHRLLRPSTAWPVRRSARPLRD